MEQRARSSILSSVSSMRDTLNPIDRSIDPRQQCGVASRVCPRVSRGEEAKWKIEEERESAFVAARRPPLCNNPSSSEPCTYLSIYPPSFLFFFFLYIYTSYFYDQLRPVIFNRKCHHSTSLYRRFKSCRKFLECRNLPVCRQTGPRGGIVRISTAIIFWRNNPRVESPEREKDNNNGSFIKWVEGGERIVFRVRTRSFFNPGLRKGWYLRGGWVPLVGSRRGGTFLETDKLVSLQ